MLNNLKFIFNHPLNRANKLKTFWRILIWQIKSRLTNEVIHQFTQHSKLVLKNGMHGATGNVYCGLHEFEDMSFLLHFLRKNELFADVGANVGTYTVLASAEVGANTMCFEPIAKTYQILQKNININKINQLVDSRNIGISAQNGTLKFTSDLDTMNHAATSEEEDGAISVEMFTLDYVLQSNVPILMKIDVEGFESEVLKGANETLKNDTLCAIIIELNGSGVRYGFDEKVIHEKLLEEGFLPYNYEPFSRKLIKLEKFGSHNTIYT